MCGEVYLLGAGIGYVSPDGVCMDSPLDRSLKACLWSSVIDAYSPLRKAPWRQAHAPHWLAAGSESSGGDLLCGQKIGRGKAAPQYLCNDQLRSHRLFSRGRQRGVRKATRQPLRQVAALRHIGFALLRLGHRERRRQYARTLGPTPPKILTSVIRY